MKRKERQQRTGRKVFWKKASSTVEAAFVLPMILSIILICLSLSYFLYNRLLITQTAYIAALRGSRLEWGSASESHGEAGRACEELLGGRLLFTQDPGLQIKVLGKNITVSIKIRQEIPFRGMTGIFTGNRDPEWVAVGKAVKQNPYRFIRDHRMLTHLADQRKEESPGKEKRKNNPAKSL